MTRPLPRQRAERPVRRPQPWWRRLGSLGDRRTGAPPAASALGLRRALAIFGLLFCAAFCGIFAWQARVVPAVVLGLFAATALIDLLVIHRRAARERRESGGGYHGPGPGN